MKAGRAVALMTSLASLSSLASGQSPATGRFVSLSAGMGIGAYSATATADYISAMLQLPESERPGDFTAAIEFFATPEVQLSDDWSLALEYSYLVKSYRLSSTAAPGTSEFSTSIHMPTVILHYLIPGQGYWLKLGGGVGYYVSSFSQSLFGSGQTQEFQASAPGLKFEAVGNTMFDESFYGYIGLDARWAFESSYSGQDGASPSYQATAPSLGFFNLGLKLGVAFLF